LTVVPWLWNARYVGILPPFKHPHLGGGGSVLRGLPPAKGALVGGGRFNTTDDLVVDTGNLEYTLSNTLSGRIVFTIISE